MPKNDGNSKTYKCTGCDCLINDRTSYKTNSLIHSVNGRMPLCKDCVTAKYNFYCMQYHNSKQAIKRMCMLFDLYYNDGVYEKCINDDGSVSIANYIQKINSVQHKGKSFEDTLREGFSFDGNSTGISVGLKKDEGVPVVDPKLIERWGSGFNYNEYQMLDEHYTMLKKNNPNITNNQEIFVSLLSRLNYGMMKALDANDFDTFSKASAQYSKMFKDAGLQVSQEVDIGSDDCWGEWVRRIEEYTPAEYYKDKNLFHDFDGIGDYFQRFVLRPLRNLIHGTTDRDEEFCVKDDEDECAESSE